jgi:hypothetical protein
MAWSYEALLFVRLFGTKRTAKWLSNCVVMKVRWALLTQQANHQFHSTYHQCCKILDRNSCARPVRGFMKKSVVGASSTISP